jgi:hypothetical protein
MRNPRALFAAAAVTALAALSIAGASLPAYAEVVPNDTYTSVLDHESDDNCDALDSGKTDTNGDPETVTVDAGANELIDRYCVKSGTKAYYYNVVPPQPSITFGHPDKDSVSHWSVGVIPIPEKLPIPALPSKFDVCGTANDKVELPGDTILIDWETTSIDVDTLKATVTATALGGKLFTDDSPKLSWILTFTDEACDESDEPTLEGSLATGTCVADAPWIYYDVTLTGETESTAVSLVITDGTNSTTLALGDLVDGKLKNKILWPGASVAADEVTPTGWPGWAFVNGQWVETDGNFAWTRGDITATLEVNPELAVALSYPPATPDCAAAPPAGGGSGSGLAETGFDGTPFAWTAALLAAAGAGLLVLRRARRVQN